MNIISRTLLSAILFISAIGSQAQVVIMPSMFGVQRRQSAPPTVQTESVGMNDQGTTISAYVNITAPAGTTITARGVCYSKSPSPNTTPTSTNTVTSNATGTGSFSAGLSMEAASIYYVRAYAVSGGTTYYGNEVKAIVYAYTGGVQTFTVPSGVTSATIKVLGAAGGDAYPNAASSPYGGKGASMQGTFSVTATESIYVLVGQKGGDGDPSVSFRGSGGGGGTFVYRSVIGNPMIIAGGGGGAVMHSTSPKDGEPGQAGTSGSSGTPILNSPVAPGGSDGSGGPGNQAGGGAGWLSAGTSNANPVTGGKRNPWNGGDYMSTSIYHQYGKGGYGGGGSGTTGDAGGGGGYSGGGACGVSGSPMNGSGGGGGSINNGSSKNSASGTRSGNGLALITW